MLTSIDVKAQGMSSFPPMNDIMPGDNADKKLIDQRINNIKLALALRSDQERAWEPLEDAIEDFITFQTVHRNEQKREAEKRRESHIPPDPVKRLQMNSRQMRELSEKTEQLAEKVSGFYPLLDPIQKRKLMALLPR